MKFKNSKIISVFAVMILFLFMFQGCGTKESINLELKNNTAEIAGELKANSSDVVLTNGNSYNIKINDKTLNDVKKFYFDKDLSDTVKNDLKKDINVKLTNLSEKDKKVYADLIIVTSEELKVATPYGYLCYPSEFAEKVYVNSEKTDSELTYYFSFVSESNTESIPMFGIQYKTADENAVYKLNTGVEKEIGLYIESYELNEENEMIGEEYNEFFVCQENVNYILENLTFNEGITVAE